MSQLVDTGQGVAEFPDEMSHDEIAGVIRKQFYSPENPPPAEIGIPEGALPNTSALKAGVIKSEGIAPPVLQNLSGAIEETVAGIPGFAAQLPKFALEGTKLAQGTLSEKLDALKFAAGKALPMGVQMAKDIESPLGSKESFRGFLQAGLMAAPGLELARGFKSAGSLEAKLAPVTEVPKLEAPPVQEVSQSATELTAKPETLTPQEEVTPQEQAEPVGVTETLAELRRRNVVTPGEVARQEAGLESIKQPWQMTESEWNQAVKETINNKSLSAYDQAEELKRLTHDIADGEGTGADKSATYQDVIAKAKSQGLPVPEASQAPLESGLQAKPELPENAEVTIKASTSKGEPLEVKMDAREAEKVLNERKTALENLIDCLGV